MAVPLIWPETLDELQYSMFDYGFCSNFRAPGQLQTSIPSVPRLQDSRTDLCGGQAKVPLKWWKETATQDFPKAKVGKHVKDAVNAPGINVQKKIES